MGFPKSFIPEEKFALSSEKTMEIINKCYLQFFSANALDRADTTEEYQDIEEGDVNDDNAGSSSTNSSQKSESGAHGLINLLLGLRDFATVVECDCAMRARDIGRVINMWTPWSVMANGMMGLKNYAIHLPWMVLLLTKVLPDGLATTLKHSLLVSPRGQEDHLVTKDFYLENHNFWLEYFYNHNSCASWYKACGEIHKSDIHQLHKQNPTATTLNNFLKMAHAQDPLSPTNIQKEKTRDIFKHGAAALQDNDSTGGQKLDCVRPLTILLYCAPNNLLGDPDSTLGDEFFEEQPN
ncbi:hypothetical protein PSHT_11888 [Puccinia striiformis]|uniref:DUF6589 domain-containing protein n=2 Tax=Puccinia striiformis TaxID=27350 RepID=A0A2S4V0A4_9BASI|nr:hypothetical protein PSHT_11888 [Puccinia striiformis]